MNFRIGSGIDIHKIGEGSGIYLGGFFIPCSFSLIGHSDADVLLHAICDSIYGALADGDIGIHFPDNLEINKGRKSSEFVLHALYLMRSKKYFISNIDLTLICEKPRISTYRAQILRSLSKILQLSEEQIGLKATTTEKLGFNGRGEGITAMASILICQSV
jgi:2-C-methyl-D-erythritol 4-phosphate cytidylyltransferase/2-C-methyl-D-erythritol 2,4-cyclodiphosphate synthase